MSMRMQKQIEALEERVAALEASKEEYRKEVVYLKGVWRRFKRRERISGKASVDPMNVPPRPKCLDGLKPTKNRTGPARKAVNE